MLELRGEIVIVFDSLCSNPGRDRLHFFFTDYDFQKGTIANVAEIFRQNGAL